MTEIRNEIWTRFLIWAEAKGYVVPGERLNWYILTFYSLLYPSSFLYLLMKRTKNFGYDPMTATWVIHGLSYDNNFFDTFASRKNMLVVLTVDESTSPPRVKINEL